MPVAAGSPLPPLAVGRDRGWGAFARGHGLKYYFNHPFDIFEHVVIPEAKHAVAVGLQIAGAPLIARAVGVLAAIDFDDDPGLVAGEVREERTDRGLPAKVRP